jgi:hypothetical protein
MTFCSIVPFLFIVFELLICLAEEKFDNIRRNGFNKLIDFQFSKESNHSKSQISHAARLTVFKYRLDVNGSHMLQAKKPKQLKTPKSHFGNTYNYFLE